MGTAYSFSELPSDLAVRSMNKDSRLSQTFNHFQLAIFDRLKNWS